MTTRTAAERSTAELSILADEERATDLVLKLDQLTAAKKKKEQKPRHETNATFRCLEVHRRPFTQTWIIIFCPLRFGSSTLASKSASESTSQATPATRVAPAAACCIACVCAIDECDCSFENNVKLNLINKGRRLNRRNGRPAAPTAPRRARVLVRGRICNYAESL